MPLLDSIILFPQDLNNILQILKAKKHTGPVELVDTNGTITVRDIDKCFIANVERTIQEADGP